MGAELVHHSLPRTSDHLRIVGGKMHPSYGKIQQRLLSRCVSGAQQLFSGGLVAGLQGLLPSRDDLFGVIDATVAAVEAVVILHGRVARIK